jgi:uncharacterized protein (TIGR03435 family)
MRTVLLICGFLPVVCAQTGQSLQFEVASVKPSPPPTGRLPSLPRPQGGPGTSDPTRINYRNVPVSMLITQAYAVNAADIVGPAWTTTFDFMGGEDRYDIQATLPAGTTKEQFLVMLQNLLAERFALKVHREKREVPASALVLAKNGPKLKESPSVPPGADPGEKVNVSVRGEDGFPVTPPGYSGLFVSVKSGHTRVKFIRYSMDQFAKWTRTQSKRPGVDKTSLAGTYDFYLEFANDFGTRRTADGATPEIETPGLDFSAALQTELGLKLVPDKTEIDFLIIDHIDRRPSGN